MASGGRIGSGGSSASGGAWGTGGYLGSGGLGGTGGSLATGGTIAAGGGTTGTGGLASMGSGGSQAMGTGGQGTGGQMEKGTGGAVAATGGASSGGAPGSGGAGSGGRAGTGGRTGNCNGFPTATAFIPSDDNRTHCYWFRSELLTWLDASKQCMREKGGNLATITGPAENEIVRSVARFMGQFPQVWIGATDDRDADDTDGPGPYRWVTDEPWGGYTNWNQSSPKQPDGYCDACNGDQDCTCDHRGTLAADGTWYDFWEENPRAYVCEAVPTSN